MDARKMVINVIIGYVLLLLLWWIPAFGPIVAGYVVGRRSENPKVGVILSSIPAISLYILSYLFTFGYINVPPTNFSASWDLTGLVIYVFNTMNALSHLLNNIFYFMKYSLPSFALMIAFGYIGGFTPRNEENPFRKKFKIFEPKLKEEFVEIPKAKPSLIKKIERERKIEKKRQREEDLPEFL